MIIDNKNKEIVQIFKNASDFEAKGKIKEAIMEMERAVKLNPDDGNLYNHLGDLYLKNNKTKEAIEAYQKGIEVFRNDHFYRNALGICKKILRYDPGNLEINLVIAKLLVDLDEKTDASIYLFSYIERQMAAGNKKEVMKAMEYFRELKVGDNRVTDKMAQIYEKVGERKMAEEIKEQKIEKEPGVIPKEEKILEKPVPMPAVEERASRKEDLDLKSTIEEISQDEKMLKKDVAHLDEAVADIERVIAELRRAIRLDEVISALDKSLVTLSDEQKKAIGFLQKSLSLNLDTLLKSINNLQQSSEKNNRAIELLVKDLNNTLVNLNKNQALLIQEIDKNLKEVSGSFNESTANALTEVKTLMSVYQKATNDMVKSLDETKESNTSLLKVSGEIRLGIQNLNNLLTRFIASLEVKEKKLTRNILIIIIIIAVMCGFIIFSIIK